jgi:4-nitrophenyl phosphatase
MLTLLCDLDGVIYRDQEPMPGAAETVAAWRAAGHRVLFATNNATRSRAEFVQRLIAVGVPATEADLATSASATASYLRSLPTPPSTAYVVGAAALEAELRAAGIRIVEDGEQPDCVVASLDRQFTYQKLARAQAAVFAGAALFATNRDPVFPGADRIWPGGGSIVAAVETACRREAVSIGKPGPLLYRTLLASSGADPARTIVVGDNLETDIPGAVEMGMPSILVLTGVSRREDIAAAAAKPTLVVETLPETLHHDLEALVRG